MVILRISSGLMLAGWLALAASGAWAAAGAVTHLSGTLSVTKPNGTVKILSRQSEVEQGDVLSTEKDSYAQINFQDDSKITVRPNTRVKIESFNFKKDEPQADSAFFHLVKGGMRMLTGFVGKRGNRDAYKIQTATATIGIRGSSGDVLDCSTPCVGVTPNSGSLPPGVYHATYTGSFILTNSGGALEVGPGQFGHSQTLDLPPVLLPADPGMGTQHMPFTLGVPGEMGEGGPPPAKECKGG